MPELHTVKLVAEDGSEHELSIEAASLSPVLTAFLKHPNMKTDPKIDLSQYSSDILDKVCEYLEYKLKYKDVPDSDDIPEFDLPTELSLQLLLVADYLNI
ncbi:hypothetical protein NCAS_0C02360 [Naumovozyma castellii]|uniref:Elongin-C n=1 Tax=Naumovozyma castellii TaxID=27288 RepID=G0VCL6_NAUCA|nr:hypothetical protein NCAS_0C02360 [Naumovozyma castellii CBS 4309]CCC69226.1 hypothetical protein NCAS_0C02360 [Naumovozyma castellii CBS 4309]